MAPVLLIVGASREQREALAELMRSEGFAVAMAASAADAAAQLEAGLAPDAILADLDATGRLPCRSAPPAGEGTTITLDDGCESPAPHRPCRAVLRRSMDGDRLMRALDKLPPMAAC